MTSKIGLTYTQIGLAHIEAVWPKVCPWIIQSIGDQELWAEIDTIKEELLQGYAVLWLVQDAKTGDVKLALITQSMLVNGLPTCVLKWAGGHNLQEIVFDIGLIESWAASRGFYGIQIWGRPGWKKLFAPLGYTHTYTVVSKVFNERIH